QVLQSQLALRDVVKETKAAPDAELSGSGWIPGNAEAGTEVQLVRTVRRSANPFVTRKDQARRCGWKYGGLLAGAEGADTVANFSQRCAVVVTKSEVDGQIAGHLEVVLCVRAEELIAVTLPVRI